MLREIQELQEKMASNAVMFWKIHCLFLCFQLFYEQLKTDGPV